MLENEGEGCREKISWQKTTSINVTTLISNDYWKNKIKIVAFVFHD
jgi:hypothetical protein